MENFSINDINLLTQKLLSEADKKLLPCLSETQLKIINLNENDKLSSQDLASIILEDYGLISKVLNTVNTFYFNRWGTYISTITKAVIILGFNTVRDIAISMAVLDLIPKENREIIVEIIAKSFCAAYLAEKLINKNETEKREEIFLSALFTNLSRVFLALYNVDIYKKISELENNGSEDEKRLIRKMWREISYKVIEKWNLPKKLLNFMTEVKMYEDKELIKTKKIIKEIYSFIDNSIHLKIDDSKKSLSKIRELTKWELEDILTELKKSIDNSNICSGEFKTYLSKININYYSTQDNEQTEQSKTIKQEKNDIFNPTDRESIFWHLFTQLTCFKINEQQSIGHLYLLAMEVLHKGIGFDNVLLCFLKGDKNVLSVRHGIGLMVKYLKNLVILPYPPENKKIKESFELKKEVVLNWKDIISVSEKNELGKLEVCISPLIISDKVLGCFMLSKQNISEGDIQKILAIRNFITLLSSK